MVEQLIRNEQVTGSIPANGSIFLFCELFDGSFFCCRFMPCAAYGRIVDMTSKKSNTFSYILDVIASVLSLAVVVAGLALCVYAMKQLIDTTNIDANALMRSPSEYMDLKRDLMIEGISFLIPGIAILLLGEFVLSIMIVRLVTMLREGRQIQQLEARIEKLEKKVKK